MIANKIVPKLQKAITKYGIDIEVYRYILDDFGEPYEDGITEKIPLLTIKGLFSEVGDALLNQSTVDSGMVKRDKSYSVITLIDESSKTILEGDRVIIKGTTFEIINISNANMLDAYFEMTLKRLFNGD